MKIQSQNRIIKTSTLFGSFLAIGVFSALAFSPIILSHADETQEVVVSATINPIVSLSVDVNALNFNMTPTIAGVFDSKSIIATVDTNSSGGYELFFSSEDNQTAMTSLLTEATIASDFDGTVTSSTMDANKWGYSLNNTDFSKIPTLANQVTIRDLNHVPTSAEKTNTVNIGMKINSDLPSGNYSKTVKFTAIAHETPVPTMQGFTCTQINIHKTVELADARDGNVYNVTRLLDGNCWMNQNLRIAGRKLTSEDSDVTSDFNLPVSNLANFGGDNSNAVYVDDVDGGFYTYYTATAGTGGSSGDAPSSICPSGWDLPSGEYWEANDYKTLVNQYLTVASLVEELNLPYPTNVGEISAQSGGGILGQPSNDITLWTSRANGNSAHVFKIDRGEIKLGIIVVKKQGKPIRCIARP